MVEPRRGRVPVTGAVDELSIDTLNTNYIVVPLIMDRNGIYSHNTLYYNLRTAVVDSAQLQTIKTFHWTYVYCIIGMFKFTLHLGRTANIN